MWLRTGRGCRTFPSNTYNQTLEDMKRFPTWVNRERVHVRDWLKKEGYLSES
jgi:hypothetical protein